MARPPFFPVGPSCRVSPVRRRPSARRPPPWVAMGHCPCRVPGPRGCVDVGNESFAPFFFFFFIPTTLVTLGVDFVPDSLSPSPIWPRSRCTSEVSLSLYGRGFSQVFQGIGSLDDSTSFFFFWLGVFFFFFPLSDARIGLGTVRLETG